MGTPVKIKENVLAILSASETEGPLLRLTGQLDRALYADVNKVLVALGGKWNRKAGAHVFDGENAGDAIEQALLTGSYTRSKQDFGQFDTPWNLAEHAVGIAGVGHGDRVLEPSAGIGRLASVARKAGADVRCVEIDPKRVEALAADGFDVDHGDFLAVVPEEGDLVDKVVMNPPFAKGADVLHVRHAYDFLKPGGKLVAIMSPGFTYRQTRPFTDFLGFVRDLGGVVEKLPDGSFLESGTGVSTVMLSIEKL